MSQNTGSSTLDPDDAARRLGELRPIASTTRLFTSCLCALVLLAYPGRVQPWAYAMVAAFAAWQALVLWRDTTGRGLATHPLAFGVVVLAIVGLTRGVEGGGLLLPVLVQPLMMLSLLHGARQGAAVGATAAAGLLIQLNPPGIDLALVLPALGLVLIAPLTALVARPIATLRQRIALAARLEHELDPRRGVQAVGLAIANRLRAATDARRVILCHRNAEHPTVLVSDQDDGAYTASRTLSGPLLQGLADLPLQPMAIDTRAHNGRGFTCDHPEVDRQPAERRARQLADLLEAEYLQLVPDAPGEARAGWVLVAYGQHTPGRSRPWPLRALGAFAMDMRRLVQQASYLDSLQAEIAAHERARIGRDLHDSALQPYLGLKFAIEVLAQRSTPDNPLHAPVQDLRQFCEAELTELRDTVAVLRSGEVRGDSTLVPALHRQAKRFGTLFGIQTSLDVPDELVTSRALSGAVLHMVNEALNNVRRHTGARNVWLSLKLQQDALHLVVRDDAGQRSGLPAPSFEPRSLTERARELGGTLTLRRHKGLDTEIHITVPI